ncbi:SpoIIE family protein phosphatase [Streptomyces nigrescens]
MATPSCAGGVPRRPDRGRRRGRHPRRRARDPPDRLRAPPPLLIRHRQVTPLQVRQPEPPLGLDECTDPGYRVETFPFEAGDLLLLYTDGVIEARDRAGAFCPLTERITSWGGGRPRGAPATYPR